MNPPSTRTLSIHAISNQLVKACWHSNNVSQKQDLSCEQLLATIKRAMKENDIETLETCSRELAMKSETTRPSMQIQLEFVGYDIVFPLTLPDFALADVGCVVWPAAIALCSHLLSSTSFKQLMMAESRTILELGCGVGTVGLLVANMNNNNNHTICLTDFNHACVSATLTNCHTTTHDGIESKIIVEQMDWNDCNAFDTMLMHKLDGKVDIILGAGIVYEESHAQSIAKLLSTLLLPEQSCAIISVQTDHDGVKHFQPCLAQYGLKIKHIEYITVITENGWPHDERECIIFWIVHS